MSCRVAVLGDLHFGEAAALFKDVPTVLAVGVNCTDPRHVLSLIDHIKTGCPHKEIVVYPNSGEN